LSFRSAASRDVAEKNQAISSISPALTLDHGILPESSEARIFHAGRGVKNPASNEWRGRRAMSRSLRTATKVVAAR
jgi:hypothetical protein